MSENLLETADDILEKAQLAAAEFHQFNQEQTERIVEAVFNAGFNNRLKPAKMAQEETGMGVWEHKVIKSLQKIFQTYNACAVENLTGCGLTLTSQNILMNQFQSTK